MGIEDRDYYRETPRGSLFNRVGGTTLLILAFIVVYCGQIISLQNGRGELDELSNLLVFKSDAILKGEVWRLFTYAFLHFGLISIICTVLFLIWFARPTEDIHGSGEFLVFVILTTIIGSGAYFGVSLLSGVNAFLHGPSAIIISLLVLAALRNPRRTILLFFVLPVPIWAIVILFALVDMAGLFGPKNPAVLVLHIASGLFAFVYHTYSVRVTGLFNPSRDREPIRNRNRQKLRIYQEAPLPESKAYPMDESSESEVPVTLEPNGLDEHLEAKVDELLEKVSKHGQESLTDQERTILKQAGEIIRNRRKKS